MEENMKESDEMELVQKTLGERIKVVFIYVARLLATVVLGGISGLAYCLLFALAFTSTIMFLPLIILGTKFLIWAIIIIVAGFVLLPYLSRVIVKIINGKEMLAIMLGLIYVVVTIFFAKAMFFSVTPILDSFRNQYGLFYNIVGIVYVLLLVRTFFKVLGKAFRGDN